jgi:hypothetical protein
MKPTVPTEKSTHRVDLRKFIGSLLTAAQGRSVECCVNPGVSMLRVTRSPLAVHDIVRPWDEESEDTLEIWEKIH